MKKLKVAVGLSGGVDSAVSAYLLKKQGFDVSGVYLHCFDDDAPGCRGKQDRQDALSVALHLKIPFQVLDFSKQYKTAVIGYFKKKYLAGRTPNPDVICNRDIKFGLLLDWCIKNGFDYLATGHYAKIVRAKGQRPKAKGDTDPNSLSPQPLALSLLFRPADEHKDQTYFLWAVPREKFSRVLFPLGSYLKTEVRQIALRINLPVADKKDSTGICFIGEVRVGDFLKRLGVKEKEGEVVVRMTIDDSRKLDDRGLKIEDSGGRLKVEDRKTKVKQSISHPLSSTTTFHPPSSIVHFKVVGRHRGVWFYTIGQRHGFEINSDFRFKNSDLKDRPPLYVIAKDVSRNRLIVGFGPETYRSQFVVSDTNWLSDHGPWIIDHRPWTMDKKPSTVHRPSSIYVRIRHLGDLIPCSLSANSEQLTVNGDSPFAIYRSRFTVRLRFAQRGVAPGQSAVFYSKDGLVLGGGVIQ